MDEKELELLEIESTDVLLDLGASGMAVQQAKNVARLIAEVRLLRALIGKEEPLVKTWTTSG